MSSGFMAGSHEARLAHVRSGHLAPMNHGQQSFFLKKLIFCLAQSQTLQRAKRNTAKRKSRGSEKESLV